MVLINFNIYVVFVLPLIWLKIEFTKTDLKGKMNQEITPNFIPELRVRTAGQSIIKLPMAFYSKYSSFERFEYHVFQQPLYGPTISIGTMAELKEA